MIEKIKRKVGRPLTEEKLLNGFIALRITEEDIKGLDDMVRIGDTTRSGLIRLILTTLNRNRTLLFKILGEQEIK